MTVNGQSAGILPVLVFGAGTDYALLLVARYREELRRHDDKHAAMRVALRRAGPAILASGATVVAALLCLSLAEVNGTAGLGPIGAMGIAVAMVTMLTVLPALLTVCGRRAFWPFVPHVGEEGTDETHGRLAPAGRAHRPAGRARSGSARSSSLAVCCLGLTQLNTDLTQGNQFRTTSRPSQGQKLLAAAFPAGANAPTDVVVPDPARVPAVVAALRAEPGVDSVRPVERGDPGVRLAVTLAADPYSIAAFDEVPRIRDAAKAAGGDEVLVGGPTAQEADLRTSRRARHARDRRRSRCVVLLVS